MELSPGQQIDRYTVETRLGEGGMAVVYRVRHTSLGTLHALKVLGGQVTSVRERLLQEGRVQAAMRHPHVVGVSDVVSIEGQPGLVMEYVDGPTLQQLLKRRRLTLQQVDVLAGGILEAVAAAHAQGLIHRDLKPANVMLAVRGDQLIPKVTDFGLAKLLTASGSPIQTRSGMAMGTPPYMSPEQIRDASGVGEPADVFSLGAILYEMLTGERCFDGADAYAIFTQVTEGDYVPLGERVQGVPERMERAIRAALQVDVSQRPANASSLLALWRGETLVSPSEGTGPWDEAALDEARSLGSGGVTGLSHPPLGPQPTLSPNSEETWSEEWVSTLSTRQEPLPPADRGPASGSSRTVLAWVGGGVVVGVVVVLWAVYGSFHAGPDYGPTSPPPAPELPQPPPIDPPSKPSQPGRPG